MMRWLNRLLNYLERCMIDNYDLSGTPLRWLTEHKPIMDQRDDADVMELTLVCECLESHDAWMIVRMTEARGWHNTKMWMRAIAFMGDTYLFATPVPRATLRDNAARLNAREEAERNRLAELRMRRKPVPEASVRQLQQPSVRQGYAATARKGKV